MDNALFIPCSLAALAVRTFALVATVIPQYPASVENKAPTTKQTAVTQFPMPIPISTKSTATKITRILYSENRNALAPSLMADEISFIRSVPGSCLETFAARYAANKSPNTPRAGTMFINICIFFFLPLTCFAC